MLYNFDITISPTEEEPAPPPADTKQKYKWHIPRRIKLLAIPKNPIKKWVYPDPHAPFEKTPWFEIDPDVLFRSDQLARLPLRKFDDIDWRHLDPKLVKHLRDALKKGWESIYFYYRKQMRDKQRRAYLRKQRMLKAKQEKGGKGKKKSKGDIAKEHEAQLAKLATPKKLFLPKALKKKWKALEELLATIDALAEPKRRENPPENKLGGFVAPMAMKYEITEAILKLYQLPERKRIPEDVPPPPGWVCPGALKFKCTPRLESLSKPSLRRSEARKSEEESNPFEISRTALKYKPTARILELAKPLERD